MKKIIAQKTPELVSVNDLQGSEIVAYRTEGNNGFAILRNLKSGWGFINLSYNSGNETYTGKSFYDCINNASKHRTLYMFDNVHEFAKAMAENLF